MQWWSYSGAPPITTMKKTTGRKCSGKGCGGTRDGGNKMKGMTTRHDGEGKLDLIRCCALRAEMAKSLMTDDEA